MKTIIIGIAGPTSSGKSTLCRILAERYNANHIKMDDFFKGKEFYPKYKNWFNWEVPENIEFSLLIDALQKLKSGKEVTIPIYSKSQEEKIGMRTVIPKNITVVEGFLLFYNEQLRDLFDLRIFVDASEEAQKQRRKAREPNLDMRYFDEVIIPAFKKYIEPTKQYANYIIDGNQPIEKVAEDFLKILKMKGIM